MSDIPVNTTARKSMHEGAAAQSDVNSLNAWICVFAWLVFALPIFVRMPLTNDTVLYDVQARLIGNGGLLGRDMYEPNLPGVVWLHTLVRGVGGNSSEALRLFDVALFFGIIYVLSLGLKKAGATKPTRVWFTFASCVYYLSLSEWCHTQRDTWMLFPVFAGVLMRITSLTDRRLNRRRFVWGSIEGLVWAAAIWIKPHNIIATLTVWLVGMLFVVRTRRVESANSGTLFILKQFYLIESLGLLLGGLVGGAMGMAWFIHTGTWPYFWDILLNWNPEYVASARLNWTYPRFMQMAIRFMPWIALHLVAIPLAFHSTSWMVRGKLKSIDTRRLVAAIFSSVYLIWVAQSLFLQHLFDYVHVPTTLLAFVVVVVWASATDRLSSIKLPAFVFAFLVVTFSPMLTKERLSQWSKCFSVELSNKAALQDELAFFENPRRQDMADVCKFLASQKVKGREVCCFNSDLVGVYWQLNLLPATRYTYFYEMMNYHPTRAAEFQKALHDNKHRFIVTDLASCGMPIRLAQQQDANNPLLPPRYKAMFPKEHQPGDIIYPWSHPVVFRAGTYLVHKIDGPTGRIVMPKKHAD